jgi:hypothetical protein
VKRLIGHRFSDESVQVDIESWPFKVIAGGLEDFPMIVVEEISSMVLEKKAVLELQLSQQAPT